MKKKRYLIKRIPIWAKFFGVSISLLVAVIIVMTMIVISQMSSKEHELIVSNMSNNIFYTELLVKNSLSNIERYARGFTEEIYNISLGDKETDYSTIRKRIAQICDNSEEIFAVLYQGADGRYFSIGDVILGESDRTRLIAECKSDENYNKGLGIWRYETAGRGYNSLVWCKDIVYVDGCYNIIELGTMLIYVDANKVSEDFFEDMSYTNTVVCDAFGVIALAKNEELLGKKFDDVFKETKSDIMVKDGVEYLYYKEPINVNGWKIASYIELANTGKVDFTSIMRILLFACVGLFVLCLIAYRLSRRVGRPVEELVRHIRLNQSRQITADDEYEDVTVIRHAFEVMSEELERNISSNYEMQIKLKEITIKAYESQMNPHFLFNTLQTIQMMSILGETDNVISIINCLGELLRFNLTEKNVVKISEEIENVTNYLKITELRLKGRFRYKIMIPDDILDCYTVKFMLQPLIENSVSHGFANKKDLYEIVIMGQIINGEIVIIVKDNGIGIPKDRLHEIKQNLKTNKRPVRGKGIGILNVHERIQIIFGEKYGIDIFSEYEKNTNAVIHIPMFKDMDGEEEEYV